MIISSKDSFRFMTNPLTSPRFQMLHTISSANVLLKKQTKQNSIGHMWGAFPAKSITSW